MQIYSYSTPSRTRGFTLIELSIVLVIIGLIIGGVLVGKNLIHAAGLRQLVKEVEIFNTAANSFRVKYNCLPGDCKNATSFGFSHVMGSGVVANGDGNGLICEGPDGVYGNYTTRECKYFWTQLIEANFIPPSKNPGNANSLMSQYNNSQNYNVNADSSNSSAGLTSNSNIVNMGNPPWRLAGWLIAAPNMYSNLTISGKHLFTLGVGYQTTTSPLYTQDAFAFDTKIDDGYPDSGTVLSVGTFQGYGPPISLNTPSATATAGNAGCRLTSTTPATYNVIHVTAPQCALAIGANF